MKTFNKYYAIIAIAAAIALVLAGCGNKRTGDITSPGSSTLIPEISTGGDEETDGGDENLGSGGDEKPEEGDEEPGDGDGEEHGVGDGEEPGDGDGEEPGDGGKRPTDPKIYTVLFVYGNDDIRPQEVVEGNTVAEPEKLASIFGSGLHVGDSNEYPFMGWYTLNDAKWNFGEHVPGDMELIAKWNFSQYVDLPGENNMVEEAVKYVNAYPNNDPGYTLFLDKGVAINKKQVLNKDSKLTVTGMDGMRTINPVTGQAYGLFLLEDSAKFILGKNITLHGVPNNIEALVTVNSGAYFSMFDGSKITGNNINHKKGKEEKGDQINTAAAVEVVNGTFTMEGGEISGNFSTKTVKEWGFPETPSAVAIRSDGAFDMQGGIIKDNEGGVAEVAYMVGKKTESTTIMGVGKGRFILSGKAEIGSIVLMTENSWIEKPIEIGNWQFDLSKEKRITLHLSGSNALGSILGRYNNSDKGVSPILDLPDNKQDAKDMFILGNYYTTTTIHTAGAEVDPGKGYIYNEIPKNYFLSGEGKLEEKK